jgi:hypothetical protein
MHLFLRQVRPLPEWYVFALHDWGWIWDALGKGIFAASQTKTGSVLLHIALTGEAQALWEQNGSIAPWNRPLPDFSSAPWAVPSPDGHRLAIYSWTMSSNMWMIENF